MAISNEKYIFSENYFVGVILFSNFAGANY